jgi:hypothetical protein
VLPKKSRGESFDFHRNPRWYPRRQYIPRDELRETRIKQLVSSLVLHSLSDIDADFDQLTEAEKAIVGTPRELEAVVTWCRDHAYKTHLVTAGGPLCRTSHGRRVLYSKKPTCKRCRHLAKEQQIHDNPT